MATGTGKTRAAIALIDVLTRARRVKRVADPWLIAKAKTGKLTIVTEETSDPKSRKKIFIPDICKEHHVPYINTIGLIRSLGGRF